MAVKYQRVVECDRCGRSEEIRVGGVGKFKFKGWKIPEGYGKSYCPQCRQYYEDGPVHGLERDKGNGDDPLFAPRYIGSKTTGGER